MPVRFPIISSNYLPPRPALRHSALFHKTSIWRSEPISYYETLGLDPNASAGAIKKYVLDPSLPVKSSCSIDSSTLFRKLIIQITTPMIPRPQSALSNSRKPTPSLEAPKSANAMIETSSVPRGHLRQMHHEVPIRALRLLLVQDPLAG